MRLLACILLGACAAGCGGAAPALHWNMRFATAGGRGMLVLHTRDVKVAERVTLKYCSQQQTELLAESESHSREQPDFRAVFPLTPTLEACLANERKVEVALEAAHSGQSAQSLALDEWSAERIYERVHVRELGELERATAGVKEQDPDKYVQALEEWIRKHPRSPALEQARKELQRVRAEMEAERAEIEAKRKAAEARKRAEAERRLKVQHGFADAAAALAAGDHAKAAAALDGIQNSVEGEAEQDSMRRARGQIQRLKRMADLRAKYGPKVTAKPRKMYAQRRLVLRDLPDLKSTGTLELEEGDDVWAIAGAGRAMVGVARASRTELATLLAAGPRALEHVEGWVEAAALTPTDRWSAARRSRQEDERALFEGRSEADRADLKRLATAGKVVSPKVQLGLLRKGYDVEETRRLALLLDSAIRAAASADDPRMPAICSGLAEVVKARGLADCAAAAKLGAIDESVAAIARDFGENSAGFASTFSIAKQAVAKQIMAIATAP